ncbi:hypothetical protein EXIGLDRAFT_763799 [Exidia glandulosa HHB12029]|uniref:DUF6534 domain-containing protein n=1 Tax=Exidia glandulosa HHB12029 TaxID=1314781 RepID=A0A165LP30_EXIGL|nr:hypothetical protein EXIGLDRAFT_763799 [Exidia glandulosa HHB12029]
MALQPVAAAPSNDSSGLPLLVNYQTTTLVGTMLASVLFGIFCAQLYQHFTSPRRETQYMQGLVALVVFAETAHIALLWIYLIGTSRASLLQPLAILSESTVLNFAVFISGMVGAVVQSFYALRIYRFSGLLWLGVLPWLGSFARASLSIIGLFTTFFDFHGGLIDWINSFNWVFRGTFGASVGVDVLNTAALCGILLRQRDVTPTTSQVIDRVIVWTVDTGLLTSAIAVLLLVLTLTRSYELIPTFLHVYPHMFALSLLFSLNARDGLRCALYNTPSAIVVGFNVKATADRDDGDSDKRRSDAGTYV